MPNIRKVYKEDNITIESLNGGKTFIFSFKEVLPNKDTLESYIALKKAKIKQILKNSDVFESNHLFFYKTYTVKKQLEVFVELYVAFKNNIPDFKNKAIILKQKMSDDSTAIERNLDKIISNAIKSPISAMLFTLIFFFLLFITYCPFS